MSPWWTPARQRGVELLDDPATPEQVRHAAMRDVVRSNTLFGGRRAAVQAVLRALDGVTGDVLMLDVATGMGDIPPAVVAAAARRLPGLRITTLGVDRSSTLLGDVRNRGGLAVAADAFALPFPDRSLDVVLCSQFLHHVPDAEAVALIRELQRVARRGVVLSDLRRSRVAVMAFRAATVLLRFHPVTRHDGVVSVRRGFTAGELAALVRRGAGVEPRVASAPFWRLTATWSAAPGTRSGDYT